MTVSLESDYFAESMKYDRINLVCGGKGSGKTHFLTQYIKYSMSQKRFSKYYLLLPSFLNEADSAYEFLKVFSNVVIFTTDSPKIIEMITNDKTPGSKLFALDDSTNFSSNFKEDKQFIKLVTTRRHAKITMMLIVHSLKATITPAVRNNVDFLFLYRITNQNLLQGVYEEFLSGVTRQFKNKHEFLEFYINNINDVKYSALFLPMIPIGETKVHFDPTVKDWNFMNIKFVVNKKPMKKPPPKKTNNKKFMLNDKRNIGTNFIRTGRNHQ